MKTRMFIATLASAGIALGVGQMSATAVPGEGGTSDGLASGPDVIVGAVNGVTKYGSNVVNGQTLMAYSFGTTSCNIGTVVLRWYQNTPFHPVIPQNAYRIKNGRFEQIGLGWMKHGFCALQENLCATCQAGGTGCGSSQSTLGVGCSDPYTSARNGTQSGCGPRFEVNAATGVFPATGSTVWPAIPSGQTTIARRVQINSVDLDPALNAGATYLAECTYVHPDDAAAGNDDNNASYIKFTVGTLSSGAYALALSGSTFQQKPAIYHWPVITPTVTLATLDIPSDGRFIVGCNVTANGNGTYRYEYAMLNLNSDRSGASFSVPLPAGVTVSNVGFKDIAYHSGEPYNSTDWTSSTTGGQIKWQCTETFVQNANANALRFGTVYNFWFDASTAGVAGNATVGTFKVVGSHAIAAKIPSTPCRLGDLDCNGVINGADLGTVLNNWGLPGSTDFDGNGITDGGDLGYLLANWG